MRLPIPLMWLIFVRFYSRCASWVWLCGYRDLNEPDGWRSSSLRKILLFSSVRLDAGWWGVVGVLIPSC